MKIVFSGHQQVSISDRTIFAWFPQLSYMPYVGGYELVHNLEYRIRGRYGIPNREIEDTLHKLFRNLKEYSGFDERQMQIGIVEVLYSQLAMDIQTAWHTRGLRGSRHAFIILAYLALEQESVLLAQALYQFWNQSAQLIHKESRKYGGDWMKALEKIQEVLQGPTTMDIEPLAMMPYVLPHHGRSRRALALPWHGHRARSLPAMRRRRSPDMRLAIPTYPSSGWTSPVMSPVGYPRGDYFEELDNLQNQQSEMSYQLNNVDQKLDLLLAGGYY
jgi:hypothetical protein